MVISSAQFPFPKRPAAIFHSLLVTSDLAHSPYFVSELSQHGESPARNSSLKTKYRAAKSFPHTILARRSGYFQSRQKSPR
jgi:hypothetical protein